jgi:methylated-DNA-[protein]-cysteine S-methyltransferase
LAIKPGLTQFVRPNNNGGFVEYTFKWINSPVGALKLVTKDACLTAILWEQDSPKRVKLGNMLEDINNPFLLKVEQQLGEYFSGKRMQFDIELDFQGTEFQREVWAALLTIPFGQTRSYSDIANQIGRPLAVRAVGAANGKNPISIIAPCHRVIGMSGELTGFAGGLSAKEILLKLEGHSFPQQKTQKLSAAFAPAQSSLF